MEVKFEIEGLPQLAARLDQIATIISGPIAKEGLAAGGEIVAARARTKIHSVTGAAAEDVVIVVRVYQVAGECYVLIGPGWDPEKFRRTRQRRGRWANEAAAPDQTTNPGLYMKFVETGHRDAGKGLAHNLDYQRARRAAHGPIETSEFGTLTTPPHPWLGPAFDETKVEALEVVAETMRTRLEGLSL